MLPISSISIAGAGNVAFHLGKALAASGIRVDFIWNRLPEKALELAALTGAAVATQQSDMAVSDLIICAVSDDALPEILPGLSAIAPVAATSGTFNVLPLHHDRPIGVLYPLQSFSRSREINFSTVPFFVESTDSALAGRLIELAQRLSPVVTELSWERRVHLHLAAVFVNNFTNHLIDIAQQHLEAEQLPFDWLKPLLRETIDKLDTQRAKAAQTGPAKRNDQQTIRQHIAMLPEHEAAIYRLLSESIHKRFKSHD
jgi:predicted short-subunit dehydrogenase-like oxidoreductase (DUF2520 family)